MEELLSIGVLMGIGGTVAMDLWAAILKVVAGLPTPNWAMVGRWAAHLPGGQVFHDDISDAEAVHREHALGLAVHYGVGILYGAVFALLAGQAWLASPGFAPVWVFSILTIAAGWFLLQPGLGLGMAASKTPAPWKARALGLVAHSVFAAGMWAVALALA